MKLKLEAHVHIHYYTDNNIHVMVTIDTSLLHIPSLEADSCVGTEAVA